MAYHQDNLRFGPSLMNAINQAQVAFDVVRAGHVVLGVVVVGAQVDDHQVCRAMRRKVPFGRVLAVECSCASRGVHRAVPLVCLSC